MESNLGLSEYEFELWHDYLNTLLECGSRMTHAYDYVIMGQGYMLQPSHKISELI